MTFLASVRKRSQKQSREEDEKGEGAEGERRGLVQRQGQGEGLVKASLRAPEASLGKQRRFTGTLKLEISCRSQLSALFEDRCMM